MNERTSEYTWVLKSIKHHSLGVCPSSIEFSYYTSTTWVASCIVEYGYTGHGIQVGAIYTRPVRGVDVGSKVALQVVGEYHEPPGNHPRA